MVRKYRIGEPIPTDSVVAEIEITSGEIPFFTRDDEKKSLSLELGDSDRIWGLGETTRGMNKRGWIYISNNTDDPVHTEDKRSLYASQNFIIVDGNDRKFGIYVDTPERVTFDIGYTKASQLVISFDDFDFDIYVVQGENLKDIVHQFRKIIGKSYVPPKWAFGYGQCRWSYMNADEVREVADKYDKAGIPLDMIYLDIVDSDKKETIDCFSYINRILIDLNHKVHLCIRETEIQLSSIEKTIL